MSNVKYLLKCLSKNSLLPFHVFFVGFSHKAKSQTNIVESFYQIPTEFPLAASQNNEENCSKKIANKNVRKKGKKAEKNWDNRWRSRMVKNSQRFVRKLHQEDVSGNVFFALLSSMLYFNCIKRKENRTNQTNKQTKTSKSLM